MTRSVRRAVVIGAGHNGLVAANLLADAGWGVVVLEANDRPGGAICSDESLHPGFVTDWFSSFYPLGAVSPAFGRLRLQDWGLQWRHAPAVLAHAFPDGRAAVLHRDAEQTARSLDGFAAGDGAAWLDIVRRFEQIQEPLLATFLGAPFPALRSSARLVRQMGAADLLRFARFAVTPVRRYGQETFTGEGAPMLLAGNALHTDLPPEAAGSAVYGWMLCMLGQTVGFPVPLGGSSGIVDALCRRLDAVGGQLRLSAPVVKIDVRDGRACGVRLADGERIDAEVVVADVSAPSLYDDLVGHEHLPSRLVDDLENFQWDAPTLKVDWALSAPIPWTTREVREAGTVHLGVDLDGLTRYAACLATKELPPDPFLLLGQMTTADTSRSPVGTESVWAYTHLPAGVEFSEEDIMAQIERMEAAIEAQAPGFGASILARRVQSPVDLQNADANLVHGAVGGGTAGIHQQLFFRPVPGLGRPETVIDGLYLGSASAHPGGGVHGAPGANAAAVALRRHGRAGRLHRGVIDLAHRRLYR